MTKKIIESFYPINLIQIWIFTIHFDYIVYFIKMYIKIETQSQVEYTHSTARQSRVISFP